MFDHYLADVNWDQIAVWLALGLFAALLITVALLSAFKKTKWVTREIAFAAICLATAYALSFIKIFDMPNGGSLTAASALPLLLFAYLFGFRKALIVGLIYSVLQIIQDPYIVNPIQAVLDYPLAFTVVAVAGLFRQMGLPGFILGGVAFMLLRWTCHVISGTVFFYMYAGDSPALLYSMIYNSYVLVDVAIAIVLGVYLLLSKTVSQKLYEFASSPKTQIFEGK